MNNVAMPEAPPCQPMLSELLADPQWLAKQVAAAHPAAQPAGKKLSVTLSAKSSGARCFCSFVL